jgi:hypothetical protein
MEVREITTAIVQEITKRDARIYELELVLSRIYANAAESPEWIRHQTEIVLNDVSIDTQEV